MSKQLVTVFGATGNQGGSVISFILSNKTLSQHYTLRGITRDITKPYAQALTVKGVELVTADLDDPKSLRAALKGSYAAFAVTNFWEHMDRDREVRQGKNVADAAKAAGVKHLVWSSLPHAAEITGGILQHIHHFDGKADVEKYIERVKGDMIASYYMPALFGSSLRTMIGRGPDGKPGWTSIFNPNDTWFPYTDVQADTGKWVAGILERGSEANGARVQAVGQWSHPQQMVDEMGEVLGVSVAYQQIPDAMFRGFLPEPVREELGENMLLVKDYSYYGKGAEKQQASSDKFLYPGEKTTSWKEFVAKNAPWF